MVQLLKSSVQWTIEVTNWKVEDKIQLVKMNNIGIRRM